MTIPVSLDRLREEISGHRVSPYLLTVNDEGRPHSVAVVVDWDGDALAVSVGDRTAANVRQRPLVTLLWPPNEAGEYSLIVDGTAVLPEDGSSNIASITPTKATLHRPAVTPVAGHSADCVSILKTTP